MARPAGAYVLDPLVAGDDEPHATLIATSPAPTSLDVIVRIMSLLILATDSGPSRRPVAQRRRAPAASRRSAKRVLV